MARKRRGRPIALDLTGNKLNMYLRETLRDWTRRDDFGYDTSVNMQWQLMAHASLNTLFHTGSSFCSFWSAGEIRPACGFWIPLYDLPNAR